MEMGELISSFEADGSLDSSGSFTISLEQARKKMLSYQSLEPTQYLLHIVAACIACGSRAMRIEQDRNKLVLDSPGSYLPESEVIGGFEGLFSGECTERALDLILGLQSAFALGVLEISLLVVSPAEQSYRWRLTAESEEQSSDPSSDEASIRLEILYSRPNFADKLRSVFRRRQGGFLSLSPEARVVDSRCEHALVPIEVNGQLVNRPYHLISGSVDALIGEPAAKSFSSLRIRKPEEGWQGALTLAQGPLVFVVDGVSHQFDRPAFLTGIVYFDDLSLDLSRLQIVEDESYRALLAELAKLRVDMVGEAISSWAKVDAQHHSGILDDLAELVSSGKLHFSKTKEILQRLEEESKVGTSVLELLHIWVSECEFSGLPELAREVATTAYALNLRCLENGRPDFTSLERLFIFARYAYPLQSKTLAWAIVAFLSAYRGHQVETEYFHKICSGYLESYHSDTREHLVAALDHLLICWFRRTGQDRLATHRLNRWEDKYPHMKRLTADNFEERLFQYALEEDDVRGVLLGA